MSRERARRWLGRGLLVLLLGPALLFLAYRIVPPPGTPLMLKRMVQGYGVNRVWVPLEAIAPALPQAVIAAEDNLFCRHWGVDWPALRDQVERAFAGRDARGASTVSMQTTKNLVLWEGRDPLRKLLEVWLAPQLDLLLGKRRLMEIYLNVAELGPGLYGAEAAAQLYFRKPARSLSRREAVLLVAVLPSPLRWSPVRPSPSTQARVRRIEARVGQLGELLDCVP